MSEPLWLLPRALAIVAPHADIPTWTTALTDAMRAAGLTTPRRIAMFLGQCAEESRGFESLEEDLYYTTADRIRAVWPSHFATPAEAAPFIGNPAWLADRVYADRMGNGAEISGDGWRFRGRGLIQVTGRDNYTAFCNTKAGRRPEDLADWLATPAGAAASACWYWGWAASGRLNDLADAWDVPGATRLINGGSNGLDRRVMLCGAALALFATAPEPAEPTADDLNAAELEGTQGG